ncbi:hypothetical protein GQ55_5G259000 [Panicum hallii var. hallii]|uniref:Uncharacterized protein n=1 Tax=Panicum hallii var. hallii TaxID=1504633 RepID=A0A2T7DK86_9POAL|nr:hypothetical protein GQ55_5G259000 [Panicum hallii var. hallii]
MKRRLLYLCAARCQCHLLQLAAAGLRRGHAPPARTGHTFLHARPLPRHLHPPLSPSSPRRPPRKSPPPRTGHSGIGLLFIVDPWFYC